MAIFLIGLVDDVMSLKPSTKLVVQIALAAALLFFGYRLTGSIRDCSTAC